MSTDLNYWSPEQAAAVTMTPAALAHVERRLRARGGGLGLRLAAVLSGCNGYKYEVDYVDEVLADDLVYPASDNIQIYVDPKSQPMLAGTQIDYVRVGLNEHFVFHNPNQAGACGCGESFNVE